MALDLRDGVSIYKLVIYIPYLFASIFVCSRHSFRQCSGWIYLSLFCLISIIGASAQLASINSHSTLPSTIAAICDVVSLSPLILASLGLISRADYFMLQNTRKGLPFSITTVIHILQIITTIAGVFLIIGVASASSIANITSEPTVHIGIILYLVSYIILLILTLIALTLHLKQRQGKNTLIPAVILSLPFLLIRICYPLIACFALHDSSFNILTGSVGINIGMSVIEEIVVVAIYTITGIKTEVVPRHKEDANEAKIGDLLTI
jgi:hypothetical protein